MTTLCQPVTNLKDSKMPSVCQPIGENVHQGPSEAALWASHNEKGGLEIHSHIPEGIKIGMGKHGRTMIATKFFPKGTIVYRAFSALVRMGKPAVESNTTVIESKTLNPDSSHTTSTLELEASADDSVASATSTSVSTSASSGDDKETATEYQLFLYKVDGTLLESVSCSEVHSVQDVADPLDNVRQVYGL